jgi:hypothetical protein
MPEFNIFGFKWQFLTTPESEYPNGEYFSSSRTNEFIAKQIIEFTDFEGNRIGDLESVDILPNHVYFGTFVYTQAMIDSGEDYIINITSVAKDYYYNSSLTLEGHLSDLDETQQIASYIFTPPRVIEDPVITISNRGRNSAAVEWYSPDADKYNVNIINKGTLGTSTGTSIYPFPLNSTITTSVSQFGLTASTFYEVRVRALAGANNQYESNLVTKSFKTYTTGIKATLSAAYEVTEDSYKVLITNYSSLTGFTINANATLGSVSRSGAVITVSGITTEGNSCLTVTTEKIDNENLTATSYELATSDQLCTDMGVTWYCLEYYNTNPVSCTGPTIHFSDRTAGDNLSNTMCYQTLVCCPTVIEDPKVYGEWSAWGLCSAPPNDPNRKRRRDWTQLVKTTQLNCSIVTTENSGFEEQQDNCCVATSIIGTKTFGTPGAWGNCSLSEPERITRLLPWTATRTDYSRDCVTTYVPVSGSDEEYKPCCTASVTLGTKSYGAWTAFGDCIQFERSRSRSWSAIETSNTINCTSSSKEVNGYEFEYLPCCPASTTLGPKTYGEWSAWGLCTVFPQDPNRQRYRPWTAMETTVGTNCVSTTTEVSGTEIQQDNCCVATSTVGAKTYGIPGAWGTCDLNSGQITRLLPWTATRTDYSRDCVTTTTPVSGNDVEYKNCCAASVVLGTKTYSAWSAYGECYGADPRRTRSRTWTATETSNTVNCTSSTREVSGTDYEDINCCTASTTLGTKTYGAWSAYTSCTGIDPNRSRSRSWTAMQTTINTSCVSTTTEVSGTETEYANCCTATSTLGAKSYGTPGAWGSCNINTGQIGRLLPWTATQTDFSRDCVTTTSIASGNDVEYKDCCSASTSVGEKNYGAWTAFGNCIQGERARSRSWTAIQTSNTINCTSSTSEVSGTEFEYTSCCVAGCTQGTKSYGAWSAYGNCIQGERARVRTWTAITTCINSSCTVLSTTENSGYEYEYISCTAAAPFFPPHFPPFFPPHFPPFFPPFFPPNFPPFFPPFFPPHFPPFFPPYFPPFFPPYFPYIIPWFGPPCVEENTLVDTPNGPIPVKYLQVGDVVLSTPIEQFDESQPDIQKYLWSSDTLTTGGLTETVITSINVTEESDILYFNNESDIRMTFTQPIFVKTKSEGYRVKEAYFVEVGDMLIVIGSDGQQNEVEVTSIDYVTDEIVNVYQLSAEPYDWFFVSGILLHNK